MYEAKRNLSALEYLKVLEIEWWICNLRRKIYPSRQEKAHYNKVASLKKCRIIEMSERNELPHIFNDDNDLMKQLNKHFSQNGGCPVFEGKTPEDVLYYYSKNSDVRCFLGNLPNSLKSIIKIGKIISFDETNELVLVKLDNGNEENLSFLCVTRIF